MSGTPERGPGASGSFGTGPVMMPGSAPLPMRGGGRASWAVAPVISRLAMRKAAAAAAKACSLRIPKT